MIRCFRQKPNLKSNKWVLDKPIRAFFSANRLREFNKFVRLGVAQRVLALPDEHLPEVVRRDEPRPGKHPRSLACLGTSILSMFANFL